MDSHSPLPGRTVPRSPATTVTPHTSGAALDLRFFLIIALALLVGTLAYQTPPQTDIPVGWPGDRLFIQAGEGLAADDALKFYGDELTPSAAGGRSRWTHAGAQIDVPGIGPGPLRLHIRAKGWPDDAIAAGRLQPDVSVTIDGVALGSFTPTSEWNDYRFTAALRSHDDLQIVLLASDTLTSTPAFDDPRPKGVRIEYIGIGGLPDSAAFVRPAMLPLAQLLLIGIFAWLTLIQLTGRPNLSFVLAVGLICFTAIGLTLERGWAVALLPWILGALALTLAVAWRRALALNGVRLIRRFARGAALDYGLVAAGLAALCAWIAQISLSLRPSTSADLIASFPDSLLIGLLGMALTLLAIVRGREGLPYAANWLVTRLASRRGATAVLLLFLIVWGGFLASAVVRLPYVGHADYADNAVVARNLLAGRGWVVDYVTQFYRLYDGVTRPQETWPLLQPVWIAPFLALFGEQAWAAKIPNLLAILALAALIYQIGAQIWDRRIAVTAVVLILTNHLFFKLVIYTTSDLLFVLFCLAAIGLLYLTDRQQSQHAEQDQPSTSESWLQQLLGRRWSPYVLAGTFTGLMLLQKPGSGGLIAVGIGLWLLGRAWQHARRPERYADLRQALVRNLLPIAVWAGIAGLLLVPYLARNLATFGKLYYSTESYDAWVLEYTEWDDIYRVYAPELSSSGVPDRSWILRWGFDRTAIKLQRQVEAVRDYLVPTLTVLPGNIGAALGGRPDKWRLLFEVGAWLSLIGAVGMLVNRRRLLSLLALAFVPYTIFLIVYWHSNEERYFVVLMPWLALMAAWALWRGYERIAAVGDGRWAPLGLLLVAAAFWLTLRPSWFEIASKVDIEPQLYAADLDAFAWLEANTPPGTVVMTRGPWQLNWHSNRPALMVPNTNDPEVFLRLAKYYNVHYLVRDSLANPPRPVRRMIDQLIADPNLGFEEVYISPTYQVVDGARRSELATEIYRFPDDYGGVAEITP